MASKRHIRRRACEGKIAFASPDAAWARIRRDGLKLEVYRCQFAKHWHIGHGPRVTKADVMVMRRGAQAA
jgi:hypothetical protein